MIRSALVGLTVVLALAAPVPTAAQDCLHGANETAEEKARRLGALRAMREINTLQANRPEAREGKYLGQPEMAVWYADLVKQKGVPNSLIFDPAGEVIPGWQLTLNKTENGYWFMIKDKADPCGFAYISNQAGIIYTAEPIR